MTSTTPRVSIVNPLPSALSHYHEQTTQLLRAIDVDVRDVPTRSVELGSDKLQKVVSLLRLVWERLTLRVDDTDLVLVLWPALGYLDVLTWMRLARRRPVALLIHDPEPLRKQVGLSRGSQWIARQCLRRSSLTIVCHTELAASVVRRMTGAEPVVVPHPVDLTEPPATATAGRSLAVRVVGQFKTARDTTALTDIARDVDVEGVTLEIRGRGWPDIAGWHVRDEFLSEQELDEMLQTAACVVVPYTHFFQSGVAVRCLEKGAAIIAPRHEQIVELYGDTWPGLVDEQTSWAEAVTRTVEARPDDLPRRLGAYQELVTSRWRAFVRSS